MLAPTYVPVSRACNNATGHWCRAQPFCSAFKSDQHKHYVRAVCTQKVVLAGRKLGETDEGAPSKAGQGLQHCAPVQKDDRSIRSQVIAGFLASEGSGIHQVTSFAAAPSSCCHPLLLAQHDPSHTFSAYSIRHRLLPPVVSACGA